MNAKSMQAMLAQTQKPNLNNLLAACSIMVGTLSPAYGDDVNAQNSAPQQSATIEEVRVIAQKRSENIQDVPKFVDVVTQQNFNKAGIASLNSLAVVVPSISSIATDSQNSSAPAIRGVKSFASSIGVQSKTGVLVDEITQPTFSTLANELIDVERVEVFAGPQSTLSGRNAAGGLISIITRAPSRTPELDVGTERTNDGQMRVTVFGTGPLADSLMGSISGYTDHRDGDISSPQEGKKIGDSDKQGARAKLRWEPTNILSATLTTYYVESRQEKPAVFSAGGWAYVEPGAGSVLAIPPAVIPIATAFPLWNGDGFSKTTFSPEHGVSTTRDRGISLRIDYDIDRLGTLSSLTNYQKSNQPNDLVLIGSNAFLNSVGITELGAHSDVATKYLSQEVRFVSQDTRPWTYLLGSIYSDSNLQEPYSRPQIYAVNWDRSDEIKSAALFGRTTYNFSDTDSLTVGLRYQIDKNAYTWQFNNQTVDQNPPLYIYSGNSSYGFWGEETSYQHYFTPTMNAYITLARAESGEAYDLENYDSKNQTGVSGPNSLQPIKSEVVNHIEIGLKSRLLDNRMVFNIDAFLARYDNYQIQQTEVPAGIGTLPVIRLRAIGKVETKGIETSVNWLATDALRLDMNAAYTAATIVDYPGADCWSMQTQGCVNGIQNLNGASMPDSPRWKYNLAADYTVFLPSLPFDGNIGAFYHYQSKIHFDTLNNPYTEQNGYGILNLYAGINTHDDRYRIQLFVNNALDKHFYTQETVDPFFDKQVVKGAVTRDAYRYAGIRFNAKFK